MFGVKEPDRLGETSLADGRRLGWAEWGPVDGTAVLLCPGAATSRWLGFGGDVIDELGVRLISVDRPGLGASDPAPGRTLLDFAADIGQLARLRGLSGLRAVGFSQGAPFALACAAAGVVSGVAVVSGGDELAHPLLADKLVPDVRRLVDAVASDATAAEVSIAGFGSAQVMWEMVISMSGAADREVYTAPDFAWAYRRALDEGFAQGAAGYARDTVLSMGRWPFDLSHITVPVELWYGGQDTSPVHSPDFGETLARRMPEAVRHFLPEAGGALLWTHTEETLRSLLR